MKVPIPRQFWATLTEEEQDEFFASNGWLNAEQCARVWRMTDRQDTPPERMQLFFSRAEVMKAFPKKRRRMWRA